MLNKGNCTILRGNCSQKTKLNVAQKSRGNAVVGIKRIRKLRNAQ